MVSVRQATVSLFIHSLVCVLAAALPAEPTNSTARELAGRQILHLGDADDLWCNRVLFKDYATDSCDGRTWYSGRTPAEVTKTTNIGNRNSGDSVLLRAIDPIGVTSVCDFILPPSFIVERLRTSGVCRKAANDRSSGKSDITAVFSKLNVRNNRRLLQRERLRDFKTTLVRPGFTLPLATQPSDLERLKVMRYMLGQHKQTLAIAKSIDDQMWQKYIVRTEIEHDWNALMKGILAKYKRLEEVIRRKIECLGGSSPPPTGSPMDTSLGRKRDNMLETKFLSILGSAGDAVSPIPLSTLERRAPTGARSGPKAAKAPSCPMKKPPPKKPVPRSQVQTKPRPAVKPRKPAKAPQPRQPSPKKKVVPRPVTRARRTPGKAVPQKRTTPKVKPRVVPKPTGKPKGKPRPRRRK